MFSQDHRDGNQSFDVGHKRQTFKLLYISYESRWTCRQVYALDRKFNLFTRLSVTWLPRKPTARRRGSASVAILDRIIDDDLKWTLSLHPCCLSCKTITISMPLRRAIRCNSMLPLNKIPKRFLIVYWHEQLNAWLSKYSLPSKYFDTR